jgi:cytochrome P450
MPHHPIFGHLIIAGKLMSQFPRDAHGDYMLMELGKRYHEFFPELRPTDPCPPLIYLDIWPFAAPIILSMHPDVSAQFMQTVSLVKAPQQKAFLKPLTGMRDLSAWEGETWRVWRKRLNPGFSPTQITARVPELVEEIDVFMEGLRTRAKLADGRRGETGRWSEVFPLQDPATRLSLDVIGRFVL